MAKTNLFETERFFLDVYGLEPGQSQAPHAHEGADKVYVVLEGQGRIKVGGEVSPVSPGDAVHAPAGVEHSLENPGPARLVALAFMAPHPKHSK
ncbi:cupin domain-containing protein [bacterium]|nr:cupin domain-containing protein [bacterium]